MYLAVYQHTTLVFASPSRMQALSLSGLFLCGEILDVFGRIGEYTAPVTLPTWVITWVPLSYTFSLGVFRNFETCKDARTLRDHRVLQDKAGSTEQLWYDNLWREGF